MIMENNLHNKANTWCITTLMELLGDFGCSTDDSLLMARRKLGLAERWRITTVFDYFCAVLRQLNQSERTTKQTAYYPWFSTK